MSKYIIFIKKNFPFQNSSLIFHIILKVSVVSAKDKKFHLFTKEEIEDVIKEM